MRIDKHRFEYARIIPGGKFHIFPKVRGCPFLCLKGKERFETLSCEILDEGLVCKICEKEYDIVSNSVAFSLLIC